MTVSTYAELKVAIASYSGSRADQGGYDDEYIDNVEAKLNRRLRIRAMEGSTSGNFVGDVATIALPTGWLETRTLTYLPGTSLASNNLTFITPEQGAAYGFAASGPPIYYTNVGGAIALYPTPDQAYAYTHNYYANIPALSGSATTNYILTNWPDAYLYGCLAESAARLRNWDEVQIHTTMFNSILQEIERSDRRGRFTAPVAAIDPVLLQPQHGNILTG